MSRPTNWAPLAESDPVPGEPSTITTEANRMGKVADEIRAQVGRLRAIGRDQELRGQYADKLRTAANELAGQLEKTSGRYERVSGPLSTWAPELEHAQSESVRALHKAQDAERARQANTVASSTPRPDDPPPTPAEKEADRRRQSALDGAEADLAGARRQLRDAVSHRDSKGRHCAQQIRDAIEDEVEDSWWDNVKDWYDRNAGWIKAVTDILSYVATALAVLALFIPGVNLLALAAIGLTTLVLASHTMLAATGNGSWADVALDVFALATFGLGRVAGAGIKGAQAASRSAATTAARQSARAATHTAAKQSSRAVREAAGRTLSSRTASAGQRRAARATIDAAKRADRAAASRAGRQAAREVSDAPLAGASKLQSMRAGSDLDSARRFNDVTAMGSRFPGNPAVDAASGTASNYRNLGFGSWAAGTGADLGDKVAGNAMNVKPYNDTKNHFTKEVGSTW